MHRLAMSPDQVLRGAFFVTLVFCTLNSPNSMDEAKADTLIVQGSTTFARRLMERLEDKIEAETGHELTVIPNKSLPGLVGLIEGRAHMAMISAPLQEERDALQKIFPKFDFNRLRVHEVAKVRIAIVTHRTNDVQKASLDQITKILNGEIPNWSQLGGANLPIRVVLVGGGGGVTSVVESELLGGKKGSAKNIIYTKSPVQLVQVVDQEPGAIGFAQFELAQRHNMREIRTERPIVQTLSFVTIDAPTAAMQSIIDTAKKFVN
jgi:phosphate transport system substrate-binding protein